MRHYFICFLALGVGIFCGCSSLQKTTIPPAAADSHKVALRNNAASLLYNLLGDEKNVSKILLIKRDSPELGRLIKAISATSKNVNQQLEQLAKMDPTLDLQALKLPPGETATREAIAKTKEYELLLSSGETFQFDLLMTQADALSYGWHLAGIAAENSSSREGARVFNEIRASYKDLYTQVIALLKTGTHEVK